MRTVALDVHKRFAEIAVHEDGGLRRLGRIETSQLRAFAESLGAEDHVVLESTAMTWAIAELLAEHAGRVTVSNPMRTRAIASAKVKTDKIDAKVLAQLGAADFLPEVWAPDEVTRALRRRIAHRSSLVRQRTRLRNQIHAVLTRNLIDAPFTDVFGHGGRQWLAEVALPAHEREQVDSNLRMHDALDVEIELVERLLAEQALARPDVRRLMTIPGVGAITALALVAVIGDASRFPSPRHLVGYLGLDPRVRQSGEKAARHGHISRAGQAHARGLLVEAAHTAIHTPGPLRAFHARLAARRGKQIALCATARKLTVLTWHLLTKDEDYRYAAPTITQRKLRSLQRKSGDSGPKISLAGETSRKVLERQFLEEAERNYRNYVSERNRRRGAGAATGDTTVEAVKAANDARQAPQSPDACSSRSGSPAPTGILAPNP
ncbi:MAG TPA: IS110 family transposase [Solirubrobacteraceae bacterium]|jgi:transposase|nr:IS110 family transposase [Solirubrobacteraceae bacterium]